MQNLNNEQQAKQLVKQVRRTGDGVVLWITITIIIGGVLISLFDGDIVSFLISLSIVLAVLGFSLFVVKLQQLTFMGNALRVQNINTLKT